MNEHSDNEQFTRLIVALEPWLTQVVIIGGWAHRLYRLHPSAQHIDYLPPVAYIADDDDSTIYLWSGKPAAYVRSEDVYGFNGKHLGWFVKGLIYNHDGEIVGVVRSRLKGPVQVSPVKSIKQIKPIKSIREIKPIRPILG